MKNKAFTLVELLGVIVVLAILALITIPIISNVINDVRIKSLENSAYGLIEASNLYYAQYGVNSNTRFNITGNKVQSSDTDKLLTYKGSVKEGTVILDRKGNVTVCITDGKNSAYKNPNESKVTTTKGKCEINEGSSIVYLDGEATLSELSLAELTEKVLNIENNFLNKTYPIGSVYTSFEDDTVTKVQNRLGGTWEKIEDRFLLAAGSNYNINTTGGSADSVVVSHNHIFSGTQVTTGVESNDHTHYYSGWTSINGNHFHNIWTQSGEVYNNNGWVARSINGVDPSQAIASQSSGDHNHFYEGWTAGASTTHIHAVTADGTISTAGESGTGKNMPPYITVYMYKRTA